MMAPPEGDSWHWTALLPGWGHLRAGLYARGIGFLVVYGVCLAVFLNPYNYAQPPPLPVLVAAGAGLTVFLGLYGFADLRREMHPAETAGMAKGRKK
ncbi:MAG: hypothetical protein HY558_03240 [Euryarchaeota archaeon]|nr:hypothetical protein [Euryarchaeota archaeon]